MALLIRQSKRATKINDRSSSYVPCQVPTDGTFNAQPPFPRSKTFFWTSTWHATIRLQRKAVQLSFVAVWLNFRWMSNFLFVETYFTLGFPLNWFIPTHVFDLNHWCSTSGAKLHMCCPGETRSHVRVHMPIATAHAHMQQEIVCLQVGSQVIKGAKCLLKDCTISQNGGDVVISIEHKLCS